MKEEKNKTFLTITVKNVNTESVMCCNKYRVKIYIEIDSGRSTLKERIALRATQNKTNDPNFHFNGFLLHFSLKIEKKSFASTYFLSDSCQRSIHRQQAKERVNEPKKKI